MVLALPMKSNFTLVIRFLLMEVVKVTLANEPLFTKCSSTRRVANTAVKNEQQMPMRVVMAKPRIGPVPRYARMMAVSTEVRLESKIAEKALL